MDKEREIFFPIWKKEKMEEQREGTEEEDDGAIQPKQKAPNPNLLHMYVFFFFFFCFFFFFFFFFFSFFQDGRDIFRGIDDETLRPKA